MNGTDAHFGATSLGRIQLRPCSSERGAVPRALTGTYCTCSEKASAAVTISGTCFHKKSRQRCETSSILGRSTTTRQRFSEWNQGSLQSRPGMECPHTSAFVSTTNNGLVC